jgi:transketolase
MRVLPGISIFEPVDSIQLKAALPVLTYQEGPVYIRLLRKTAESVFQAGYHFKPGKADVLKEGRDLAIIASVL